MPKICHTVESAKSKWCPFSAAAHGESQKCLAGECMAWVWVLTNIPDPHEPTPDNPHPEYRPSLVISHDTHGRCGLTTIEQK